MKRFAGILLVFIFLFSSCAPRFADPVSSSSETEIPSPTRTPVSVVLEPSLPGTKLLGNELAQIDASSVSEGYIGVRYIGKKDKIRLQLTKKDQTTYTYILSSSGTFEVFPFSEGSGTYTINIYENISGDRYALAYGTKLEVSLEKETSPFLYPNQYVWYTADSDCIRESDTLTRYTPDDLDAIEEIYNYVVENISYDSERAASVSTGYLPDVDQILRDKKGICFDYAALMVAMIRVQRIPARLVVGYSGSAYHAWISVYIEGEGWIDGIIKYDGSEWALMDPTFAATAYQKNITDVAAYFGDGSNYNALYVY